jgi:DNA-binding GntR family transcriptional regulator
MDAPHRRLAAALRQRIVNGAYPPGSVFPSVRTIAAQFDTGLGAAYQAVALLRSEGLLEGEPRRRLTVAHPVGVRTLADPDAEWPHGRGDTERTSVRADADLAVRLDVPLRTSLRRERVELLDPDGRPAMVATTWRRGAARTHTSCRFTVQAQPMGRADADLLGLAVGMPALVVQRTRYDAEGRPVEVADVVLPADRWRVSVRGDVNAR